MVDLSECLIGFGCNFILCSNGESELDCRGEWRETVFGIEQHLTMHGIKDP